MSDAVKVVTEIRDRYIREHCQTFNDGHWVGTASQREYVSELDDIIEALRRACAPPVRDVLWEALENLRRRCQMILPSDSDESKLARLIERDITAALSHMTESEDIVGKLWGLWGIAADNSWTQLNPVARQLIKDAAAEITRLRADLARDAFP